MLGIQFKDHHTYANVDQVRATHLSMNLKLDFDKKVLEGACTLHLSYSADKIEFLDLDSDLLEVLAVKDDGGQSLRFEVGTRSRDKGSRLRIHLEGRKPAQVTVSYRTNPKAEALQWLDPQQTTSGKLPFLFTQSQSIFARTWIPCMDSPGVRTTYDATLTVPPGIVPVMSAEHGKHEPEKGIYRFKLDKAIPSYLIALAAGELAFKPISDRCGVYAEPAVLDAAVWEFADMENMVKAAEKQFGPYRWGRWDAIVLPPSFPFGGMENPLLTFVTPTLIAGDRSLTSVMAHELAHSWSGNLVTNASWRDFWLNEGFTTYCENRIIELIYGKEMAEMNRLLGQRELHELIESLPEKDSILYVDLEGRHPDDGFTGIPYEKGNNFLSVLEHHFGRDSFDTWLIEYFNTYGFQSITSQEALAFMKRTLFKGDDALWKKLRVDEWVYQPGLPDNIVVPVSDKFEKTRAAAEAVAKGDLSKVKSDWITAEWLDFLNALPEKMSHDQLAALDKAHKLNQSGNSEIKFAWLMVAIRNSYEPAYGACEAFLSRQGRRKFLKPLYQALYDNPDTRALGKKIYAQARKGYHPIAVTTIDAIMKES